jgi:hypothetical protein
MTKKDYKPIAREIYFLIKRHNAVIPADALIRALSGVFSADNSNFDARRFARACHTNIDER